MNELLFKLKKDGKTVGYERYVYCCDQREGYVKGKSLVPQHSKDGIHWEYIYLWDLKTSPKGYWFKARIDGDVYIEHNERCPYVCKDKNDKDVFAKDKVKRIPLDNDLTRKIEGTVIWHYGFLQWVIKIGTNAQYRFEDLADSEIFESELELIEEEE